MGVIIFLILVFLALLVISTVFKIALALLLPAFLWMLAGMFAGRLMRGRGYGPIGDIILGLVGGMVGSLVLGLVGIHLSGIIGSVIVGTIGAVIFVYIVRVVGNKQFAR